MTFRITDVGYKITKFGRHVVSCTLTGFGMSPSLCGFRKVSASFAGAGGLLLLSAGVGLGQNAPQPVDLDAYFAELDRVNGAGGTGYMEGDEVEFANRGATHFTGKTFTDFFTKGGDGSGGGAGLGGVFYINDGIVVLTDVQFTGNVVKGGTGGGFPDVNLNAIGLPLIEREAEITAAASFNLTPSLTVNNNSNSYQFGEIALADLNSLFRVGQYVSVEGATGNGGAKLDHGSGGIVLLRAE